MSDSVAQVLDKIATITQLCNIWNWIGAFAPEARLIHNILEAAAARV